MLYIAYPGDAKIRKAYQDERRTLPPRIEVEYGHAIKDWERLKDIPAEQVAYRFSLPANGLDYRPNVTINRLICRFIYGGYKLIALGCKDLTNGQESHRVEIISIRKRLSGRKDNVKASHDCFLSFFPHFKGLYTAEQNTEWTG